MQIKSFRLISTAAFLCFAVLVLTGASSAQTYTYTTVDFPVGVDAHTTGINDSGDIVGYYLDNSGDFHGFLDAGGRLYTFDDPNASGYTVVEGIDDSFDVVGSYEDSSGVTHGFVAFANNYATLDDPKASGYTAAIGINENGEEIVGYYTDSNNNSHGFVYNLSTKAYTTLDDPNGVGNTYAFGINDSGDIVGYYKDSSGNYHGFLYNGSTYTTIDDPNGLGYTKAYGINDSGDIVGFYIDSNGAGYQGFLYDGSTYTTIVEPNGVGNTYAIGINAGGDIVGYYFDSSDNYHGFLAVDLWQNGVATGGGWYYLDWFGAFNTNSSPWIYHNTLGWLYPIGTSTGSIWFWDPQWDGTGGWWWTSASAFPWVYSATEGTWYYYDAGDSNPSQRWFCNAGSGCALH